uniref:ATP-binding cassette domain-containing protein n=1 Tax=Pantoea eucalypti TaxID=470933 RepID=UPI001CA45EA0
MRRDVHSVTHMLDVERVSWSPGGAVTVLDSVALTVAAGEFVGLVGPNGSGKTSLLRCVFRYARPDAG